MPVRPWTLLQVFILIEVHKGESCPPWSRTKGAERQTRSTWGRGQGHGHQRSRPAQRRSRWGQGQGHGHQRSRPAQWKWRGCRSWCGCGSCSSCRSPTATTWRWPARSSIVSSSTPASGAPWTSSASWWCRAGRAPTAATTPHSCSPSSPGTRRSCWSSATSSGTSHCTCLTLPAWWKRTRPVSSCTWPRRPPWPGSGWPLTSTAGPRPAGQQPTASSRAVTAWWPACWSKPRGCCTWTCPPGPSSPLAWTKPQTAGKEAGRWLFWTCSLTPTPRRVSKASTWPLKTFLSPAVRHTASSSSTPQPLSACRPSSSTFGTCTCARVCWLTSSCTSWLRSEVAALRCELWRSWTVTQCLMMLRTTGTPPRSVKSRGAGWRPPARTWSCTCRPWWPTCLAWPGWRGPPCPWSACSCCTAACPLTCWWPCSSAAPLCGPCRATSSLAAATTCPYCSWPLPVDGWATSSSTAGYTAALSWT